MAKRKKHGSQRSRPKVPGSSQFARFSSAVGALPPPRLPGSGELPAVSSDQESSPLPEASAVSTASPPCVSISDLEPQPPSVSVPVLLRVSPSPELTASSSSCCPLAAVEASVSGIAVPEVSVSGLVAPVSNVSSTGLPSQPLPSVLTPSRLDKRWTSLFGESSQLEEVGSPSQHISGVPFVLIPDENIAAAREEFKDFIFAQFQDKAPEMGRIIGVVNALGSAILLGRNVWNIAGFPMFVSPWSPDFTPDAPPITTAEITAELRGVPYLLFNKESLSRIATAVAKPIALAPETERKETFEVAKVLVRVDLTKELPSKVISGFSDGREVEIAVTYPWLPPRCSECNAFGHDFSRCPSRRFVATSLLRRSNRSRSRPRTRLRSRQGRSSERWVKASAKASPSNKVWQVKGGSELGKTSDSLVSKADIGIAVETHSIDEDEVRSANQILEWLAVGKNGPATGDAANITANVEESTSQGVTSQAAGKQIADAQEAPFILVTRRRSGRKDLTREWISLHKPLFGAFLETHIQSVNAGRVSRAIPVGWNSFGNFDHHSTARIVVCWDPSVSLIVYQASAQLVTCGIFVPSLSLNLTVSFAYGQNLALERTPLWEEMASLNANTPVSRFPWAVVGDFNQILRLSHHSEYLTQDVDSSGMDDFNLALQDSELFEAQAKGLPYTWWNNQEDSPASKKIDHALINQAWATAFPESFADFMEPIQSDHAACFFHVPSMRRSVRKPFKFFQHVADHPEYHDSVSHAWTPLSIQGTCQFKLVGSLRKLKIVLRKLNKRHYSGITERVKNQAAKISNIQRLLLTNPDAQAAREEHQARALWQTLISAEEKFFRQKSRVIWLHLGDKNTAFFHKSVIGRAARNHIHFLSDHNGRRIADISEIKSLAASYFEDILGCTDLPISPVSVSLLRDLLPFRCSETQAHDLQKPVSLEEIVAVVFAMPLNKSPGPDGFSVEFFRASWDVVGKDVVEAVQEFFRNGRLLKDLNCTIIALIPKVPQACHLSDFRPISCCNLIYKIISKIIANRMKPLLQICISSNHAAFLKGRSLGENVLLASELIKDYHKSNSPKSCMIKVDIRKAFDTVCWDFILKILEAQNFPPLFLAWVKECISSPRFSISINGELAGFFPGKKGIRQGDPISPYLFILVMEVLSKLLDAAASNGHFRLHPLCSSPRVTHLLFADDLLVFNDGARHSLSGIAEVMRQFKTLSGLDMNPTKSEIFFGGYNDTEVGVLSALSGIKVGSFPTRYLGLPLNPKRISFATLQPFLEKITSKLHSWTSKFLSFAGKIRLISSVIYGMVNFWSAVFNLPKKFYEKVDSLCASFHWKNKVGSAVGARVAWKDVCKPKEEGGLGIRRLEDFQVVFQLKLIWIFFASAGSLWVAWLKGNVFHRKSFWVLEDSQRLSRTVKCMLKLKPLLKDFLQCEIGNGKNVSFWFVNWCGLGPLIDLLGASGPRQLRVLKDALVSHAALDGDWRMPAARSETQQLFMAKLTAISPPNDLKGDDLFLWKRLSGTFAKFFSSKETWEQIRQHSPVVSWHKTVWFKEAVPRYSFIAWLAFVGRLPTRDRLRSWGLVVPSSCVLCSNGIETHHHLFFDCTYSATIWEAFAAKFWPSPPSGLLSISDWILQARSSPRTASSQSVTIVKLILQAACYHIWRERNARIFTNVHTASAALQASLDRTLRDRLLSLPGSPSSSSSLLASYFDCIVFPF
ncbi:Reverse transcriptase zinc-binding domain [Arabidopsis thaliana x Arabidopsis arenosa]|uniref:Reverse transcriptase zinc-binding domain n=1 Tax=Arabidopsis thaliana x Arabidopsis arenosa TaxID=1240361 RepID=A0A8T1Y749_9BRAS|nr:Reverse transcriptase zinc-binding domain [Arabidopsis thaliana x Arabidopsis arenosa]